MEPVGTAGTVPEFSVEIWTFAILWGVHPIVLQASKFQFLEWTDVKITPAIKGPIYARKRQDAYPRSTPENERLLACFQLPLGRPDLSL